MSAIKPYALAKRTCILEIATSGQEDYTRIGSVRNVIFALDTTANSVEVKADDTKTVFKGFTPEIKVTGSFLEVFDRDLMNKLLGGVTSNVAGAAVNNVNQEVASGAWNYNNFIKIENQNGDGSAITVDSVTGGADGALISGTDYHIVKNDDGDYGIVIIDSANLNTEAQLITIVYDYTPNTAEKLTFDTSFQESKSLKVRITSAADENGNNNILTADPVSFQGTLNLAFVDVVEAGDITGTDFELVADDGATVEAEIQILAE